MSKLFKTAYRSVSNADFMYTMKEHLKTAGWLVKGSGDGQTNFSTTTVDYITSATVMAVAQAWIRLRSPTGTIEIILQTTVSSQSRYRAKISPTGFVNNPLNASGVVTGTPSVTACPSASDQLILNGSIDDTTSNAGNSGATLDADGAAVLNGFADTAAPYGFFFWGVRNNAPLGNFAFLFDPLVGTLVGDPDPWIAYFATGGPAPAPMGASNGAHFVEENNTTAGVTTPKGWINRGGGSGVFSGSIPAVCSYSVLSQALGPIVPGSTQDVFGPEAGLPVEYARRAAAPGGGGWKGVSTLLWWRGTSTRHAMEVGSRVTAGDTIVFDDIATYWNGTSPLF